MPIYPFVFAGVLFGWMAVSIIDDAVDEYSIIKEEQKRKKKKEKKQEQSPVENTKDSELESIAFR